MGNDATHGAPHAGRTEEIYFDACRLEQALRYHLRDAGVLINDVLRQVKGRTACFSVPRETWSLLDDDQRLMWLLEASQARRTKGLQNLCLLQKDSHSATSS